MRVQAYSDLIAAAEAFCAEAHAYSELFGVTDGKAVGTFIEREFQASLKRRHDFDAGNSAMGLDLPTLNTDIKVTSVRQPQSSCPYRSSREKVYGLGYHLLLFVYDKQDDVLEKTATLRFVHCFFVEANRTADYQTTRGLLEILNRDGNREDIFAFLSDRNLPGDEIVYNALADEIIASPPQLGYLTISNALQWRLQYGRLLNLSDAVSGITRIV